MNDQDKKLVVIEWYNGGVQVVYMYGTPDEIFETLVKNYDFNTEHDMCRILLMTEIETLN